MYVLGRRSLSELDGVHPKLVSVVKRAIEITKQDFSVHDGLRTIDEQKSLVARGASKTMNSRHLRQSDGYGHAVDLVPYINGKLRWEWPAIYPIALAMSISSQEHDLPVVWGGVWDRRLSELGSTELEIKNSVHEYCLRHPGPDFIDGPHYQI